MTQTQTPPRSKCSGCLGCQRGRDLYLDAALDRLHQEGRYRTFIDIERRNGQFPHATWRRPDGTEQPITVWCGNDYL
ncbi:hypothetical protein SAMN05443432_11293, partial [Roseovarius litoreus]